MALPYFRNTPFVRSCNADVHIMPFEMAVFSCLLVGVLATGVQKILKPPLYADLPPLTPPKIARPMTRSDGEENQYKYKHGC